jgi:transmembrane sensor
MDQTIITIIQLYLEGHSLTDDQAALLQQWRQASPYNEEALQRLQNRSFITAAIQQRENALAGKEQNWQKLTALIATATSAAEGMPNTVAYMPRRRWLTYAAAAVLLLGIGFIGWWTLRSPAPGQHTVKTKAHQPDIMPGRQGAWLTLADGSKKLLDSLGNGIIADQKGTSIQLENGHIRYDASKAAAVQYNTMTTPRGRTFRLTLPDGTQAWLNAASSITYPTAFTEKERKVTITGEVYFEVTHNAKKPFLVAIPNGAEVQVLGTHFNVNAYDDEDPVKTTLLEGVVRVVKHEIPTSLNGQANGKREPAKASEFTAVLKPGEQAVLSRGHSPRHGGHALTIDHSPDLDQVMAWKNGVFNFEDQTLEQVMKHVSRWYDIDIRYANGIPKIEFFGEMGRDVSLQKLLHFLERSGVKFTLDAKQKQLTVL